MQVTFLIRFKSRRFNNIVEIVDRCNHWQPQAPGLVPECSTIDITPDMPFPEILEEMQRTDILVSLAWLVQHKS